VLALLLAAICVTRPVNYAGLDVRPLNPQTFFVNEAASRASYAYDGTYEYVGTAQGLFRTLSIASPDPLTFTQVLGGKINQVVVRDEVMHVLMEGSENPGPTPFNHTLLKSTDQGRTYTTLDAALQECTGAFCRFLAANQIDFLPNGSILLSAGGNLMVTSNGGTTWKVLYPSVPPGPVSTQTCPMVFARKDLHVVIGGECPLDSGYVALGDLKSDFSDWQVPPRRLSLPDEIPQLENRNALFAANVGDDFFVGVEGGLLKSCDSGVTFRYVIRYPLSGGTKYPYAHQFLAPVKYPNVRLIAGFDKATMGPYLAWSADGGETWRDASALLPPDSTVALLTERRDGLPMIFVQRGTTLSMQQLIISELPLRRRGVRH
jgi:hypothetical protein